MTAFRLDETISVWWSSLPRTWWYDFISRNSSWIFLFFDGPVRSTASPPFSCMHACLCMDYMHKTPKYLGSHKDSSPVSFLYAVSNKYSQTKVWLVFWHTGECNGLYGCGDVQLTGHSNTTLQRDKNKPRSSMFYSTGSPNSYFQRRLALLPHTTEL